MFWARSWVGSMGGICNRLGMRFRKAVVDMGNGIKGTEGASLANRIVSSLRFLNHQN